MKRKKKRKESRKEKKNEVAVQVVHKSTRSWIQEVTEGSRSWAIVVAASGCSDKEGRSLLPWQTSCLSLPRSKEELQGL